MTAEQATRSILMAQRPHTFGSAYSNVTTGCRSLSGSSTFRPRRRLTLSRGSTRSRRKSSSRDSTSGRPLPNFCRPPKPRGQGTATSSSTQQDQGRPTPLPGWLMGWPTSTTTPMPRSSTRSSWSPTGQSLTTSSRRQSRRSKAPEGQSERSTPTRFAKQQKPPSPHFLPRNWPAAS